MYEDKFELIAQRARQDSKMRFTSLMHYINAAYLEKCFKMLKKDKACGVDDVTFKEYEVNLRSNIASLIVRLKRKEYNPKPSLKVYIPKPGKVERRPLGIPTIEDKMLQMAVKNILENIFEQDFRDCSHGFRKNRSCHTAIQQLDAAVMKSPIRWAMEADIVKFFDMVNHEWMMECLEQRIADPNILWLVRKFLKAGFMEEGRLYPSEAGTPQGGVISPLLANIYLHFVLDRWFDERFKPESIGHVELIRYCDDFVVVFEETRDAYRFGPELTERFAKFGLELSQEKTRMLEFGRTVWKEAQQAGMRVETFDFLGFTHYCAKSRAGYFTMGHKTAGKTLSRKLKAMNDWLRACRNALSWEELLPKIRIRMHGHFNFFGINGNMRALKIFYHQCKRIIYKWINRRSQKKSMNWEQFNKALKWMKLPKPGIRHAILY